MGGKFFSAGANALLTPRMPSSVYHTVQQHCHLILKQFFIFVGTPIIAPEKETHGDIDIVVACPLTVEEGGVKDREAINTLIQEIGGSLQAVRAEFSVPTSTFAIPWPSEQDELPPKTEVEKRFIQVDLNVCSDNDKFAYQLFHHSHADLWNILGSMIRPFGLTVNDEGLWIRIEKIEARDRGKSMIFLTRTPSMILSFLGLDESRWWSTFPTMRDLYLYAVSCRFFSLNDRGNFSEEKQKLKANDRKRMKQRPMFANFVKEFIPELQQIIGSGDALPEEVNTNALPERAQIMLEAFERFPGTDRAYQEALAKWQEEGHQHDVWTQVKAHIPFVPLHTGMLLEPPELNALGRRRGESKQEKPPMDNHLRGAACRGLKAIIFRGDTSYGILPPADLKDVEGFFIYEKVEEFVRGKWLDVADIELQRTKERHLSEERGQKEQLLRRAGSEAA